MSLDTYIGNQREKSFIHHQNHTIFANMNCEVIRIFNPDNDLALAYGQENYTAPPLASTLKRDLQLLPLWYCNNNDKILCENSVQKGWLQVILETLRLNIEIITTNQLASLNDNIHFIPWGWSADMRKRLIDKGVIKSALPDPEYINNIRDLSHRRTSIIIHREIHKKLNLNFSPIPVEFNNFEDIKYFAIKNPECYIKSPWSSSGKGIFRVLDVNAIDFERWTKGILKRQGSIICETALPKILDFAMEFYSDGRSVNFSGYSIFYNDSHSSFDSGIVANEAFLENIIIDKLGNSTELQQIKSALESILSDIIRDKYTGYLGIDMLLYKDGKGTIKIDPCVEINLRMTMGALTSIFSKKYLAYNKIGIFKIEYFKNNSELNIRADSLSQNPPIYEHDKLISGVQFLSPYTNDSRYLAYISINS